MALDFEAGRTVGMSSIVCVLVRPLLLLLMMMMSSALILLL